jgi:anthranilate phosphoribosyltransferase
VPLPRIGVGGHGGGHVVGPFRQAAGDGGIWQHRGAGTVERRQQLGESAARARGVTVARDEATAEATASPEVAAFAAEAGVAHDIVALNAGAALYVSGQAKNIPEGIEKARAVMHSGAASAKMRQFIDATRTLGGR